MEVAIKRNSKEFKKIRKIISSYKNKSMRIRSIILYNLKPYQSIDEVIELNTQKKNAAILYDLAFNNVDDYFDLSTKKLFRDEDSGIYYFKSSAASKWKELPFSFKKQIESQVKKTRPVKLKIV